MIGWGVRVGEEGGGGGHGWGVASLEERRAQGGKVGGEKASQGEDGQGSGSRCRVYRRVMLGGR